MTFEPPTMDEVRAAEGTCGLKFASLFAGAGLSSLGYRLAAFGGTYANELDRLAAETYELNSEVTVDRRDVRTVSGRDILEAAGVEVLDVLDGSPPCQDFSMARGRRDLDGENASLYYEFVRLVGEIRPRAFCAENVRGLVMGESKERHFLPILQALHGHGYRVAWRVLDASRLGVPQARQRVVVIGFRDDTGIDPALGFPAPLPRTTSMRDALPHAAALVGEGPQGTALNAAWREQESWPAHRPAPTLAASGMAQKSSNGIRLLTRDGEERPLEVPELKALMGCPEDFRLPEGTSLVRAWKLMGNAVPPPMARAWAEPVRDALLDLDN